MRVLFDERSVCIKSSFLAVNRLLLAEHSRHSTFAVRVRVEFPPAGITQLSAPNGVSAACCRQPFGMFRFPFFSSDHTILESDIALPHFIPPNKNDTSPNTEAEQLGPSSSRLPNVRRLLCSLVRLFDRLLTFFFSPELGSLLV